MSYGKRPLWQWILLYAVVAVIVYGAIYYFFVAGQGGYGRAPSSYYPGYQNRSGAPESVRQLQKTGEEYTVTYTDAGFSPATIAITHGAKVVFKNAASDSMRVSSNPHPIHTGYPTTGGCIGSTFDSCRVIWPGESWPFTFDKVGTWGYHNHLNPSEEGTVVVR
ncbi:MAG: hypothetical protein HY221_02180 [Candidatus Sungbacteria bacterium]|uniref:Uncharacterized protein n=1 Tax=Candidatus Sungiibacteriota bacterium TaxID=2750080 RepID=A0A932VSF3_9BACT|nr:hypothetical protein [Candidatus Sungbacteria bacterium]